MHLKLLSTMINFSILFLNKIFFASVNDVPTFAVTSSLVIKSLTLIFLSFTNLTSRLVKIPTNLRFLLTTKIPDIL